MALFTDFNTSFAVHPTKKDLSLQTDVDAVKQSIKNLVLTDKMERLFQPTLGCDVRKMLFENFSTSISQFNHAYKFPMNFFFACINFSNFFKFNLTLCKSCFDFTANVCKLKFLLSALNECK